MHVEQYRYPDGPELMGICPPLGIESCGGGGRYGVELGGNIPGSNVAALHKNSRESIDDTMDVVRRMKFWCIVTCCATKPK